jgi:SAM-dependent methyltransferase
MTSIVNWMKGRPPLAAFVRRAVRVLRRWRGRSSSGFPGTESYWQQRYAEGGDSGLGSYGKFAQFKAQVLNELFADESIGSVIEFGCGDGNQVRMLKIADYLGVDVSPEAIERCRRDFDGHPGRRFIFDHDYHGERAQCSLSLDVVYHLVEQATFHDYMRRLFDAASHLVVIYSSNRDSDPDADGPHIRHRMFTRWVDTHAAPWKLHRVIPNPFPFRGDYASGSFSDFFVFVPRGHEE